MSNVLGHHPILSCERQALDSSLTAMFSTQVLGLRTALYLQFLFGTIGFFVAFLVGPKCVHPILQDSHQRRGDSTPIIKLSHDMNMHPLFFGKKKRVMFAKEHAHRAKRERNINFCAM